MRTTDDTIQTLKEAIDKLEEIKVDFPKLSWYPAHHSPSQIWNGNLECLEGKNSIIWRLSMDVHGIALATHLGYHNGNMWASVKHNYLPSIPVMNIYGIDLCHWKENKQKIMDVVKYLPEDLRLRAYRIMANHRRKVKKEKTEKLIQLRRELKELENESS